MFKQGISDRMGCDLLYPFFRLIVEMQCGKEKRANAAYDNETDTQK